MVKIVINMKEYGKKKVIHGKASMENEHDFQISIYGNINRYASLPCLYNRNPCFTIWNKLFNNLFP